MPRSRANEDPKVHRQKTGVCVKRRRRVAARPRIERTAARTILRTTYFRISALACVVLVAPATGAPAWPQLRGHGGPVRALAVSADGTALVSGSFDNSAILWS